MPRFPLAPALAGGLCLAVFFPVHADDRGVLNALALQQSMEKAQHFLLEGKPAQAVEALEAQLARVQGHAPYLRLLRKAYRAHITGLWLNRQDALARTYLERLCVIEPAAAQDPTLRPPQTTGKGIPTPPAPPPAEKQQPPLPDFAANHPLKKDAVPAPKTEAPMRPRALLVRGQMEDAPAVDPFDASFRRPTSNTQYDLARDLLQQADGAFGRREYAKASQFFHKAFEYDQAVAAPGRDRWAYCLLHDVVEKLNAADLPPMHLTSLKSQVEGAVRMAPNLGDTGRWLLKEIENRVRPAAAAAPISVAVRHHGRNAQGWMVAESENFIVFHREDPAFAERVARVAETTRRTMAHKWFGKEEAAWTPKCEVILHPTAEDYTKMTGVPGASPGHARIETDPSGTRVVSRRLDLRCDQSGLVEAVLPHEATHVVLAGRFGKHHVPRWADEGIAVLSEPTHKIEQHRRNLLQEARAGKLFALQELMGMNDYPHPKRIGAFYAQSVFLVDFLTRAKGPTVFTAFVRDGLDTGWDGALRRHYGLDHAALEARFRAEVLQGGQPLAAR